MNVQELRVEMLRHKDTGGTLARLLGISEVTFSKKLNAKIPFNQSEINEIKKRYDLKPERLAEIFFAE